jgi:CheY-like chemotaxis protein
MKFEINSNYILVVEDDVQLETTVKKIVSSIDPELKIVWFTDGERALEFLIKSSELPRMILLDLLLPGRIDGLRLHELVTQMEEPTPIAFMSSLSRSGFSQATRSRYRDLLFIGKPLVENQARRMIEICLSQSNKGLLKVA